MDKETFYCIRLILAYLFFCDQVLETSTPNSPSGRMVELPVSSLDLRQRVNVRFVHQEHPPPKPLERSGTTELSVTFVPAVDLGLRQEIFQVTNSEILCTASQN